MTVNEVATALGVSRSTVYRYIRDRKLVPARRGRQLLISRGQVRWLKSPESRWVVPRDYTDEQIEQFLRDDVLTPEQQVIADRIWALSDGR